MSWILMLSSFPYVIDKIWEEYTLISKLENNNLFTAFKEHLIINIEYCKNAKTAEHYNHYHWEEDKRILSRYIEGKCSITDNYCMALLTLKCILRSMFGQHPAQKSQHTILATKCNLCRGNLCFAILFYLSSS